MTAKVKIYLSIAAVMFCVAATTCGYERGVSRGKSVGMVAHDDSVGQADRKLISTLVNRANVADGLTKEAIVERDTAQAREAKAQARRDTSKALANAGRSRFTLRGDTAIIDGLEYVLPKTVSTYVRLEDTAIVKQGLLDAARTGSDSNASWTIARLLSSNATKDKLIETRRIALLNSDAEIKDLKAMKAPRLTFVHGLIAATVVIGALIHFVR